ncbi:MAG: peptide chain release factor N(5)-glutamine methyltransferase [Lachnospiraceae bacterium]|nr:peptide chain release factor N(5)-glutamine methyltransferase [Lachnospiraceae bacterium]
MKHAEGQELSECKKSGASSRFVLNGENSLAFACKKAEAFLTSCGIEDAAVDAWLLLEYVTGISRAAYLADRDNCMSEEQRDAYAALVDRRGAHIPLQHLTGEQEFMGMPFLVNEHVLIPRQDTETLVELALAKLEQLAAAGMESGQILQESVQNAPADGSIRESMQKALTEIQVLDLCTGSGCIAVSLTKLWERHYGKTSWQPRQESPTDRNSCRPRQEYQFGQTAAGSLRIIASDISEKALIVARENARRLQADVQFVRSDLFSAFCTRKLNKRDFSTFHMIVSNPPYIRSSVIEELSEEVRAHEPRMALDGGEDGLEFYRRIIRESREYLLPGGWLLLEIGFDQGEAVSELMRQNGFLAVQVAKDLPGHDRVVSGQMPLCECVG